MCHGTQDGVIAIERARQSRELLDAAGLHVEWKEFPMQHEVCLAEITLVSDWLQRRLTPQG
jgi:phospholipase/carboxylesterase